MPFVLPHRSGFPARPAIEFTMTIPAATELRVKLLSGIHSRVSHVGDPIKAQVLDAFLVNGRVALPPGSFLDGRITRIRPAGRAHRAAELAFRFDQITLPDGQAEAISTTLAAVENARSSTSRLDPEGYLKGPRFFPSKGIMAGAIGVGALAIPAPRLLGSTALKALVPLCGAAWLGYEIFLPRGNDVHVLPDTHFRIRLNYPLTVHSAG